MSRAKILAAVGMKRCYRCASDKPTAAFYNDKSRYDGLRRICKECDAKRFPPAPRYEPKSKRDSVRDYEAANPEKLQAWRQLRKAIVAGTVVPWPACAVPECTHEKPQAHHADYSRPLDVVWLCPLHHKQAHRAAHE